MPAKEDRLMNTANPTIPWPRKLGISILLLICGLVVFFFGSNYFSIFPTNDSQLFRILISAAFLAAALFLRRKEATKPYSHIAYAFFIGMFVTFMTSLTLDLRASMLSGIPIGTSRYEAFSKLFEVVLVVVVILILNALWGQSLGSLYIRKGRLALGLFVGICLLLINTATGIVTGAALGTPGEALISKLPWVLLFSLANSFMEELWLRGLFLRRFTAVIGVGASIVVTSIIFTVMHAAAEYMDPIQTILFQVVLLPMALLLAYLMHKTDSIWGSVLYHAGSDAFMFYLMGW
jgi:membrane protease YdiL (CAAX protease family)